MADDQTIKKDFNDPSALKRVPLASLKPTQLSVGMREVERKQQNLRELSQDPAKFEEYIEKRPILVVLGPQGSTYVIDHHHLALALLKEGQTTAPIKIAHDFSDCTQAQFWQKMQDNNLLYLCDANGQKREIADLPADLAGMQDDPYRSLAWFVREAGGYDKVDVPYVEFKWVEYFRAHIDIDLLNKDFDKALRQAMKLAEKPAAAGLPGYKKPAKVARALAAAVAKISKKKARARAKQHTK